MKKSLSFSLGALLVSATAARADTTALEGLIARHAAANGVPAALVHRVVKRESNYNPRAVGRGGAMGLMQIKHATARGMGYSGPASGLLDAETNLSFAVPYLAGAYRVAGGNQDRAVSYYASGYYYVAKRLGLSGKPAQRQAPAVQYAAAVEPSPSAAPAEMQPLSEMR